MKFEFVKSTHTNSLPMYVAQDYLQDVTPKSRDGRSFLHTIYRTGGSATETPETINSRLAELGKRNLLTLTQINGEQVEICVPSIMMLVGVPHGTTIHGVIDSYNVREKPDEIYNLIQQL
ncbi:hypothetical protein DM558_00425 [Entomomonas moraniae]|uniref:Uncharacterized protein n=1 Tax=Entomomonas moraniae TaxID=2213226 RepID=A0A3Q9JJS2_9GAMM|nr:hypothetical protein [Entomomonas moraniae]AZS49334.1 hypothetical protein DM558_00425 [Entomomonas moraniae]